MEIKRISKQKNISLLEFYNPTNWSSDWVKMPVMMLDLLNSLKETEHAQVRAFTSHAELLFTNKDDFEDWQVLIRVIWIEEKQFYQILAAQKNPWHCLTGYAEDYIRATELVISGLSVAGNGRKRNFPLD